MRRSALSFIVFISLVTIVPATATAALPPPTVVIDATLKPHRKTIAGRPGGAPRPLVAIAGNRGVRGDFVENEIIFFSNDLVAAQKLAQRWNGQLVASVDFPRGKIKGVPAMHLIRVTSSLATPATIPSDLQAAHPNETNHLRVSSGPGLLTLAVAARERRQGLQVGLNWVLELNDIHNRTSLEKTNHTFIGPDSSMWTEDAFTWPYISRGSTQDIGVGEAWRALVAAGKTSNRVDVLIVDSGFDTINADDFPPGTSVEPSGTNGVGGPGMCNNVPCPFHGNTVALAGFAQPDNDKGAAGPGGLVANLHLVSTPSLDIFEIFSFLEALISNLFTAPRLISISGSSQIPASVCLAVCPALDLINVGFRAFNILTVANAGNDGSDVDDEDCIGAACWEAGAKIPCEVIGVLCAGGLEWDSRSRGGLSNWGHDSSDPSDMATVRMFAPLNVWFADRSGGIGISGGTSVSAPFVAGVAALVMAADPFMGGDGVHGLLVRTANPSPDPTVPRVVNAFEAVKAALGGTVPPTATLISPLDSVDEPQDHLIEFEARATSSSGQNISSQVVWSSDLATDNPLPQRAGWIANDGANPAVSLTPGTRRITASVTDGAWTDSTSVDVTVREVPVTVEITMPSSTRNHFFPNENVVLLGESAYLDGHPLPDGSVSWFLDNTSGTAIATGHGPIFIAASSLCAAPPCQRSLLFHGSNGRTQATDQVDLYIDPTPTGPPPTVTITNPANNASFSGTFLHCTPSHPGFPGRPVYSVNLTLQGSAVDQTGAPIPAADLTWHKYHAAGPALGTGGSLNVTLRETQFSNTQPISTQIFLAAMDSQRAVGSASVTVIITTPLPPQGCP
jgi:serine protease